MSSRGTLTLAFGKPRYIEMAKSLARSLILHDPTLMRAIVTDSTDPELADLFTYRIDLRPEYGSKARQMMHLDLYTPFDETLFIDSDSLAVRSLDAFWTAFHAVPFGVCGVRTVDHGETDESLDAPFLDHFDLTALPKFNGAIYYFKRSPKAAALFTTARDLLLQASELHFTDLSHNHLSNTLNNTLDDDLSDEALYAVAMAIHGLTATNMGGGGMWTAIDSTIRLALDIPNSICTIVRRSGVFAPDILHIADFTESLFYLRECSRLEHLAQGHTDLTLPQELQLITTATILWARRKARSLLRHLQPLFPTLPTPTTQH
jgi:hypothetical protein